jgi:ferric-dicitrate binding protein FerR (iron transport regulator)
MSEKKYSVKDFLLDERFQQWVRNPEEVSNAYWKHFQEHHPEARQPIAEARNFLLKLNFEEQPRSEAVKQRIRQNIHNAINTTEMQIPATNHPYQRKEIRYYQPWIRVAASLTAFILIVGGYLFFRETPNTRYTTGFGQTKTISLPDGSMVKLNANSSLIVAAEGWKNEGEREIWLEGEAFFEVEKRNTSEGLPAKFQVHSGKVTVEVLGTKFNVNSRHQQTKVVLSSGKVKLNIEKETEKQEVLMEPGELVEVDELNKAVEKRMVDPVHFTSWTENKLIFENTPLSQIRKLLEDNYGLKWNIENSDLLSKEFTGTAPADEIDILLEKLSLVYNLNLKKVANEVTIEEK